MSVILSVVLATGITKAVRKFVVVNIKQNNNKLIDNVLTYCFYYFGAFRHVSKKIRVQTVIFSFSICRIREETKYITHIFNHLSDYEFILLFVKIVA